MTAGRASAGPAVSAVAPIRLKATTFSPASGEGPNLPPGLTIAGYATRQRGYYIVQFEGPVVRVWKDAVTIAGAELLGYIPTTLSKSG